MMLSAVLFLVLADEGSGGSIIPGCFAALLSLGITGLLIYWMVKAKQPKTPPVAEKLTITSGVFFGRVKHLLIGKQQNADGHVLVVGGAGSGKSSCIAIPTLRDTWTTPALVVDIKGELYEKSRRPRACVFNPMKTSAMGYDPFYLLKETNNPVAQIRDMALTLCPMEGTVKDPFWIQAAQNVLTGHLLFGWKSGASFIETLEVLQSVPPKKLIETENKDSECRRYLMQFADMDNRTLSSIMVELANKVVAFATDPEIGATLSKSEIITPTLLEEGYDIFLQLPEHKLEQWRPMISLIVQQFARHFERRADYSAVPILFLLDEFPRLGKMETVLHGLATLRSKRITIMPIVQSLAQLDATYGSDQRKVICDNCSYKAILGATDADTQKYFSQLVGTEEREKKTYSKKDISLLDHLMAPVGSEQHPASPLDQGKSVSTTTEEKAIIRPEEFAYLKDIVLLTPHGFLRVEKVPYYTTTTPALISASPETPSPSRSIPAVLPQQPPIPVRQHDPVPTQLPSSAQGEQTRRATPPPPHQETPAEHGSQGNSTSAHRTPAQQQQPAPAPTQAPNPFAKYEAALTQLAQFAPKGTPLEQLAQDFAARLSPAQRSQFETYWLHRQHQQQAETAEPVQKPEQAENASARYEAALATLAQYAPKEVSQEALVLQFASKLPPAELPGFLAWWQRTNQERTQGRESSIQQKGKEGVK